MPRLLHMVHGDELHEMPYVQGIRRGIEADVERHAFPAEFLVKFVLEYRLFDETSRAESIHNVCSHKKSLLYPFVFSDSL